VYYVGRDMASACTRRRVCDTMNWQPLSPPEAGEPLRLYWSVKSGYTEPQDAFAASLSGRNAQRLWVERGSDWSCRSNDTMISPWSCAMTTDSGGVL